LDIWLRGSYVGDSGKSGFEREQRKAAISRW
jgi:hypothetical protein